jgi:hypothetical protein
VDEGVADYLLRHTRLIPRDVVSLGNALCQEILHQKSIGRSELPPQALRSVISKSARRFGNAQLAQCGNQIAADMMPGNAAVHRYSDVYTSSQEYARSLGQQLREIIGMIGVDRFGYKELMTLREAGNEVFDSHTDVPAVLWQNGLLGYTEAGVDRFYSLHDIDDFEIPEDVEEYVFHPCMIDSVRALRSVGSRPVHPYVRE